MGYTSVYGKQTAEHVESRTWHSDGLEMRVHKYRCKACRRTYIYSNELYERCPFCGFPILHYRRAS